MTDRTLTRIIEVETILHDCTQRIGRAMRNLDQSMGGYPSTTPGNGSPGGGHGTRTIAVPVTYGHNNPITINDNIPITAVEAAAIASAPDHAAATIERLHAHAVITANTLSDALWDTTGQNPVRPGQKATTAAQTVQAYRCAILLRNAAQNGLQPSSGIIGDSHKAADTLWRMINTWAWTPGAPTTPRDLKPVDLTGNWCVNCLRVGAKEPRWRRDLCRWCERFQATEGFPVPVELTQARHDGHRVTDAMVAPFRQSHAAKNTKKRSVPRSPADMC